MSKPNIIAISGSLRAESFNTIALKTLAARAADRADITIHALDDVPLYNQDLDTDSPPEGVANLRAAMKAADAIILATPEYNYGAPGVLLNALDWASRPYGQSAFKDKTVWVISASPATTGGTRAHTHLYPALIANGCNVIGGAQVCIPQVHQKIADGALADETTIDFMLTGLDRVVAEI